MIKATKGTSIYKLSASAYVRYLWLQLILFGLNLFPRCLLKELHTHEIDITLDSCATHNPRELISTGATLTGYIMALMKCEPPFLYSLANLHLLGKCSEPHTNHVDGNLQYISLCPYSGVNGLYPQVS